MNATTPAEILDQLDNYDGQDVWNDVILGLDYDEDATEIIAGPDTIGTAVIGGRIYSQRADGTWTEGPLTRRDLEDRGVDLETGEWLGRLATEQVRAVIARIPA